MTLPMNRHAVGLERSGSDQAHPNRTPPSHQPLGSGDLESGVMREKNIDWSHGGGTPYAVDAAHAASTLLSIRP